MKRILLGVLCVSAIFFIGCKKEKNGENCIYRSVSKEMIVTFIDGDLNNSFTVSLQPNNSQGDEVYRLDQISIKKVYRNFDLKAFQNKENTYIMSIDEILKGSCVPFKITKLRLR